MTSWQQARQARDDARRQQVLALPTRAARWHADLAPPRSSDQLVTVSIGYAGEAICLWSSLAGQESLSSRTSYPGWATFPDARTPSPAAAVVTVHSPEPSIAAVIPELTIAHPTVQLMPGGNVLVVGARAYWRSTGPDRNAVVFATDGTQVLEATLGDGIEHVQTTPLGNVWVGYFDEGVYGNYGWNDPGAPAPIGHAGIVRFNPSLELDWEFPSHVENPWGSIDGCYALNVIGETPWACYYSDFPIVRVHDGTVDGWRNSVRSAKALATDSHRVLLAGGYGPDHDRLVEGSLDDAQFRVEGEYRLTLPDGAELPTGCRLIGRGATLHVIAGNRWHVVTIDG